MLKKIISAVVIISFMTITTIVILKIGQSPNNLFNNKSPKPIPISEIKIIPEQTGGIVESIPIEEKQDADAMGILMKNIPLSTENLSIDYNYSKGKFIVRSKNVNTDVSTEFDKWYSSSQYQAIPSSRFLLVEE